jgi:hypothetical protein
MTATANFIRVKPGFRIEHPDYGDMTEDVARELATMTAHDDAITAATADARQAQILAATPGPARITPGFALKAQIDARVHDYWRRREGTGFWKHELKNMLRRHPELAVKAQSDQARVSFATPTTAPRRGGRWAKAA